MAMPGLLHAAPATAVEGFLGSDIVPLGKTGIKVSRLAQGTGFNGYNQELAVERIDVCLIHCMLNDRWPSEYKLIRDELSEMKDKGAVRAVGVSCHDFGALKVAAEHPWVDVIFARINHKGGEEYSCDASAEEVSAVLKQARHNGKAIVGMKIFGAGKLIKPEEKAASLEYVFRNDLVDAITVGMLNTDEVDDTLKHMSEVTAA